jgi:GntR family transcriptional regulator
VNLDIDPSSPVPLHAQLAERIRLAIATGRLAPGDRLPTVRQLAVDLRVNSNTVARVYMELERAGVLETRRGLGTFVAPGVRPDESAPKRRIAALCRSFLQTCSAEGYTLRDVMHALREIAQEYAEPDRNKKSTNASQPSRKDGAS